MKASEYKPKKNLSEPLHQRRSRLDVIFNEISGAGDPDADLETIEETLRPSFPQLHVWKTSATRSGYDVALDAIKDGGTVLIACGGDGTVAGVAAAIKEHQSSQHPSSLADHDAISTHNDSNVDAPDNVDSEDEGGEEEEDNENSDNVFSSEAHVNDDQPEGENTIMLGVIPRGTANALCSALHIPANVKKAAKMIVQGPTRRLDFPNFEIDPTVPSPMSSSNSLTHPQSPQNSSTTVAPSTAITKQADADDSHDNNDSNMDGVSDQNLKSMLLLCGIGFEAKTVRRASRRLKKAIGSLAYAVAGLETIWTQPRFKTTLTLYDCIQKDTPFPEANTSTPQMTMKNVRVNGVTIANAAPPASVLAQGIGSVKPDDGFLEVICFTSANPLGMIGIMLSMLWGALVKRRPPLRLANNIHGLRVRKVLVDCSPPQPVVVDGESVGNTPVLVTLDRKNPQDSIHVIAPKAKVVTRRNYIFSRSLKRLVRNMRGLALFAVAISLAKSQFGSTTREEDEYQ